ncbi:amidohydrolase family protein [Amycolatopsis jiangsuensis]|uniref:Putative TIM-barrel fold metal-dependent hydrolase n=1 Tax=Amycolatopsis jiangsuensis TaxID=1181879 RepID=A0A840IQ69_9PSEU|nr:amidohydrolase family protein [Amycolatopsis jiangsuensis]MBB4683993.1 putative TIM-barrel fold metal-dependent hydrolase [Amycolatopsis jiangsuensis]
MFSVDTHTHIISPDTTAYPAAPLGGHRSEWSRERPADLDELLRQADAAGVEHLVLVQASTVYGFDNSYVADQLGRHPGRLSGVCSVDFLSPKAVDDLGHWIGERGFSGVRIRAADGTTAVPTPGRGLDDERMTPVWEFLSRHRVPVCIQMHAQHAPVLAGLLARYPGLTVVLDHAARPRLDAGTDPYPTADGLPRLSETGRVFVKLTPPAVLRAQREAGSAEPLFRALVGEFGAAHVLWGSNFPASAGSLSELAALVRAALPELGDAELALITGGTAARLYGLPATGGR